ncbi:glycoside hydrolase family 43 protein [Zunongwangia sp. H14]|uniref:glycoside hydrolase family 43 protein n=1 Tax=Zunongwangia sp. H14 TaxID=3240792 RepID=UPI00356A741F
MRNITFTFKAFGILSLGLILFSCASLKTEKVYTNYLFAYFTGNGQGEEAVRYALSSDGYNYYALNDNNPIINSDVISKTGGVRDPHILRTKNGSFYMVLTDLLSKNGWTNTAMIMLKSDDLVNWTSTVIDIPQIYQDEYSEVMRVWAPQTIYDEKAGKYMIYFSMLQPESYDKIYYAYANEDFTGFEAAPDQLFFNPAKTASIDGDIVKKNGKFYLFYKTEGEKDKGIKVAISNNLTSGYEPLAGNVDQTDKAVEGSGVFKLIDSDKYILMYDVYMNGKYQFTESKDLKNFKVIDEDISMNFHPRHGTVIPITAEETKRLIANFPSGNVPGIN